MGRESYSSRRDRGRSERLHQAKGRPGPAVDPSARRGSTPADTPAGLSFVSRWTPREVRDTRSHKIGRARHNPSRIANTTCWYQVGRPAYPNALWSNNSPDNPTAANAVQARGLVRLSSDATAAQ